MGEAGPRDTQLSHRQLSGLVERSGFELSLLITRLWLRVIFFFPLKFIEIEVVSFCT